MGTSLMEVQLFQYKIPFCKRNIHKNLFRYKNRPLIHHLHFTLLLHNSNESFNFNFLYVVDTHVSLHPQKIVSGTNRTLILLNLELYLIQVIKFIRVIFTFRCKKIFDFGQKRTSEFLYILLFSLPFYSPLLQNFI